MEIGFASGEFFGSLIARGRFGERIFGGARGEVFYLERVGFLRGADVDFFVAQNLHNVVFAGVPNFVELQQNATL